MEPFFSCSKAFFQGWPDKIVTIYGASFSFSFEHNCSVLNGKSVLRKPLECLGVDAVFECMDTCKQGICLFELFDGHSGLNNHRAMIHFFIHKVYGGTGNFDPVGESVCGTVEAREAW